MNKKETKKVPEVVANAPTPEQIANTVNQQYVHHITSLTVSDSISEIEMKPFWMIHRGEVTDKDTASIKVYWDKNKALSDIVSLSTDNPGATFYLMESIQVFRSKLPSAEATLEFKEFKK